MKRSLSLALVLTLPLVAGCLENEEEIEVRPDGTVRLTVAAVGDVSDLVDGYPVPLEAPWQPATSDTERWIERLGASTGGADVRTRLRQVGWQTADDAEKNADAELRVTRDFPSVESLPRTYASRTDPYRDAYLQRSASLDVLERGGRTVYVFERTYHGRIGDRFDPLKRVLVQLEDELSEEELAILDESEELPPELWSRVAQTVHDTYREMAELYARRALEGLYTRGDASLPPHRVPVLVDTVVEAVGQVASLERLESIYDLYVVDDDLAGEAIEAMSETARQALRDTLTTGLADDGMNRRTINAVLFELESSFTAVDHSTDLGDEEFVVHVTLPGELVSGNFDASDGATATWRFDGDDIGENGRVLRVVSVLE